MARDIVDQLLFVLLVIIEFRIWFLILMRYDTLIPDGRMML